MLFLIIFTVVIHSKDNTVDEERQAITSVLLLTLYSRSHTSLYYFHLNFYKMKSDVVLFYYCIFYFLQIIIFRIIG